MALFAVPDNRVLWHINTGHAAHRHIAWHNRCFGRDCLAQLYILNDNAYHFIAIPDDCLTLQCEVKFVLVKNLRPVHKNWGEASFKAENRVEEGMERLDIDQLWRDRALYADVTIVCQGR